MALGSKFERVPFPPVAPLLCPHLSACRGRKGSEGDLVAPSHRVFRMESLSSVPAAAAAGSRTKIDDEAFLRRVG